mgnify:CR=1 FL=1
MRKNFIRKKEDFECQNCGYFVEGTGYTNHCHKCLYSKHVDLNVPGDRGNKCGGLMKPVGVEIRSGKYVLIHKCQKCGVQKKNKSAKNDNFDAIIHYS